jgi:hypothetical protein
MKKCSQTRRRTSGLGFYPVVFVLLLSGCESLRFAPNERQKQNAWLHNRTALAAAQTAKVQPASGELQDLTELSELQSRAFTTYFGLPKELPPAQTSDDILAESSRQLAKDAIADSAARPDPWQTADAAMELGIGICGLLGGVYGAKAAKFLKDTKDRSKALREIITGNELFKKANQTQTEAFKQAHASQSPETRLIVTEVKGGA